MELGAMELYHATGKPDACRKPLEYGRREPVTPWMGADSARHYQWYPFMNMGHYHLATVNNPRISKEFIRNMRTGIERTYEKAVERSFPARYSLHLVFQQPDYCHVDTMPSLPQDNRR